MPSEPPSRDAFLADIQSKLLRRMVADGGADPDGVPTLLDHGVVGDDDEDPPVAYAMESGDTPVAAPGRQSLPIRDPPSRAAHDRDHELLQMVGFTRGITARQTIQDKEIKDLTDWCHRTFARHENEARWRLAVWFVVVAGGVAGGFGLGVVSLWVALRTIGWLVLS
jgi:hypothetical protein